MKRVILLMLIMLIYSAGQVSAQTWLQVNASIAIDIDSIKKIQIGNEEVIKVNTKSTSSNSGYTLCDYVVKAETQRYCLTNYQQYDEDNKRIYGFHNKPTRKSHWMNGKGLKWIEETIKRAN